MKLRSIIAACAVAVMALTLVPAAALAQSVPGAAASEEETTDVGTYHVGARFNVRPHVGYVRYNGKRHVVGGTVGLTNNAKRARTVTCRIVITFQDKDGTARVKRDDMVRVRVGPNTIRHPDYRVQLRDTIGRDQNQPVNAVGHCHNHTL